jgi:hypothetical protein
MLNIRKRTAVVATVFIFWGACPPVMAEPVVPEEVVTVVSPLDSFKEAKVLTKAELKDLLKAVGFEGKALKTAWAVAMKESNGRPVAHNGNRGTGDNSYGVFQINMIGSLGEDRREKFNLDSNADLFDPVKNAKIAFHMSNGGKDWSAWKVYPNQTNGERYESFLKAFPKE